MLNNGTYITLIIIFVYLVILKFYYLDDNNFKFVLFINNLIKELEYRISKSAL